MGEKKQKTCLVINADDLGKSPSVNAAIEKAHRLGVLNSASIMAGGEAFGEAVELAGKLPGLSVGLHATFCDGRSVLPHSEIPGLVDKRGFFEENPAKAGLKYWTQRKVLSGQIEAEIEAQFDRLQRAGIQPSHVDSHHHLHAHPVLFAILSKAARKRDIKWMRMPPGPLGPLTFDGFLKWASRCHEWAAFKALEVFNVRAACPMGFFHFANTYGLSHTGHVCEDFFLKLIPRVRGPVAEVFLHPDLSTPGGARELDAVLSAKVKMLAGSGGITLAGFKDIPDGIKF